jgi:hypothetical protein
VERVAPVVVRLRHARVVVLVKTQQHKTTDARDSPQLRVLQLRFAQ